MFRRRQTAAARAPRSRVPAALLTVLAALASMALWTTTGAYYAASSTNAANTWAAGTWAAAGSASLYATGANTSSQLGLGDTAAYNTFTKVGAVSTWATIAAGDSHTCGVRTDGSLWCWGSNSNGQLGDGTTTSQSSPVPIAAGTTWSTVRAGRQFTCGIRTNASLWCWGSDNGGKLGTGGGSTIDQSSPAPIAAGTTWTSVATGGDHACGIQTSGSLWYWGLNLDGQIGDGTSGFSFRGSPVPIAAGTTWTGVSAGDFHTCGTQTGGSLWCWGNNGAGRLGDGTTTKRVSPTQVVAGTTWTGISAGGNHTCGIQTSGSLWCWGQNSNGQLGDSTTTKRLSPTQVATGKTWATLSAGATHTCGNQAGGTVWCWGDNSSGAIGIGATPAVQTSPAKIASMTGGRVFVGPVASSTFVLKT